MSVDSKHPLYKKFHPQWEQVSDCVEGARAIKEKGTDYLPKPNPGDHSVENDERYKQYKERANFVNFTGSTLEGLLGMVFRKEPVVELPPSIEYLIEDSDGAGQSLEQAMQQSVAHALEDGRDGLLADYPVAPDNLTEAEVSSLNLRANIIQYKAENIINWQTAVMGGVKKTSMVVLKEQSLEVKDDGFSYEDETRYRVLELVDGYYAQSVWEQVDGSDEYAPKMYPTGETDDMGEPLYTPYIYPRNASGQLFDYIPFYFIGAVNNDEEPDKSPLYDISSVNIAHYRNSADYEESCFIVGQPTPWVSGLNQSWVDEVLKSGIMLGSRAGIMLPEGGSAGLLQASPNQMPLEGMREKEAQMVKLGARIIMDSTGTETAEAARIRFAGQNSKLGTIVGNVEEAYKLACESCQQFMGGDGEVSIELNKEFYDKSADPQLLVAQIQLLDRGVIAKTDLRSNVRRVGLIDADREDEDIDSEAEGSMF